MIVAVVMVLQRIEGCCPVAREVSASGSGTCRLVPLWCPYRFNLRTVAAIGLQSCPKLPLYPVFNRISAVSVAISGRYSRYRLDAAPAGISNSIVPIRDA